MDERSAIAYCMRLLARREYGRAILIDRLIARDVAPEVARTALDSLSSDGLQSDERCAVAIIRTGERRGWSRRRTRQRMLKEGLDRAVMAAAPWPDDDEERARARRLFESLSAQQNDDRETQRKILARVARRGFPVGHLFE
jgi:regulatory protein